MKPIVFWLLCGLVLGCGGSRASGGEVRPQDSAAYQIHEWGVITLSRAGTTVSAGPLGAPVPLMAVEKPVIYLHASAPVSVRLEVLMGPGFDVAEHYPPTTNMHWGLEVTGERCAGQHAYPTACGAADGVCEVPELARYETLDAACLQVGDQRLPLLFYRLGAAGHVTLPSEVRVLGPEVSARSTREGLSGWRVALVDGEVRAAPVTLTQGFHPLPTPSQPWQDAANALDEGLRASGLTEEERSAFHRAWWQELFGAPPPPRATDDPMHEDHVAEEQTQESERALPGGAPGGSEVLDVLFYLMPPDEIDRVARIVATPPPSEVSRAFLVRHVL